MNATEQIKSFLKPYSKVIVMSMAKDIQAISSLLSKDESIVAAGVLARGFGGISLYLGVLTNERLLTTKDIYEINLISNVTLKRKALTTSDLTFEYKGKAYKLSTSKDTNALPFYDALYKAFTGDIQAIQVPTTNAISMQIQVLVGKEQLSVDKPYYELLQYRPGEVVLNVGVLETFTLIKWDRTENIQKSLVDIAGWSFMGSFFGNAGTLAGGLAANNGNDKSVATLYLKRANNEQLALIIKCDKKDLGKLALFRVAVEETAVHPPSSVPTEDLIKLKELVDLGVLTSEEFDAKKKQLLGI